MCTRKTFLLSAVVLLATLACCGGDQDEEEVEWVQSCNPDEGGSPEGVWHPRPGTTWQWQLTGLPIDLSYQVTMYDIDLFEVPEETIDALHAEDRIVICYFSAGSHESWRPDAAQFPSSALGEPLDEWEGERWLDIRDIQVRQVMRDRLDLAVSKGCDGVEPDNVDGYANDNGFDLSYADQLEYNRFLAAEAHDRGLSIGLKNDLDQVGALVCHFDWALNEECFAYDECEALLPFIQSGKAVFQVEYGPATLQAAVCPRANALDFDTLIKNLDLDAWRISCR
ncbi:MAG: endo alpha-1,4 polygalactosaminidase [Bradymonadales bacterium]|nr:endo alpha-1,4 polygalactosaminidase [Bradymonadales bacterium]